MMAYIKANDKSRGHIFDHVAYSQIRDYIKVCTQRGVSPVTAIDTIAGALTNI
jgi:hypothetical protein